MQKKESVYDKFKKKEYSVKDKNIFYQTSFLTKSFRWTKHFLISFIDNHIIHYPTPINLNYLWSFGSLAGISLLIQIVSGTFLSMHYSADINYAFVSIERIMRDIENGWFVRYVHSNGSSMFFFVVYVHIAKGIYYGSYMHPREMLWCSGVVIYFLMMATAFMGYVLPWGQMSYWGATVITNMVTVVPVVGKSIVHWFWGGFTLNNSSIKRFYILHVLFPFIILGMTFLHLALLHRDGSNNPLGVDSGVDKVTFYPYYFVKDLFAFWCYLFVFIILVFFYPNALGDPNNYIPADPMETPAHVVPEWYFLPFYAVLRCIPHKAGGIITMFSSLVVLFTIPFTNTSIVRSTTFRPIFKFFFWLLMSDILVLGWIGQAPMKEFFNFYGQVAIFYYFLFFIVILPLSGILENSLATYKEKTETKKTERLKKRLTLYEEKN